jgi:hypothetical protein
MPGILYQHKGSRAFTSSDSFGRRGSSSSIRQIAVMLSLPVLSGSKKDIKKKKKWIKKV